MSTQNLHHASQGIAIELTKLKPYLLAILKKGANYDQPETQRIIQTEHLPYIFDLKAKGIMAIPMPVKDDTDIAAIGIFTITDKELAAKYMNNDPAVKQGIFTYELLHSIGLKGDSLT